jgi:hypothetical protein
MIFRCLGIFLLALLFSIPTHAQNLEDNYKNFYLAPFASFGSASIIRQNNYGYSTLAYELTPGFQAGFYTGNGRDLKKSFKTGLIFSFWGQNYRDVFSGKWVEKTVRNQYLQLPLLYKFIFLQKTGNDFRVSMNYLQGGVILGYLMGSEVRFYREGIPGQMVEESLTEFVTFGRWNENTDALLAFGDPVNDRSLFKPYDINLEIAYGYQKFVGRQTALWIEIHGVIGLTDINAENWRYPSNSGTYRGSYNFFPGLKAGANIYFY